jgi:hypothetical protein
LITNAVISDASAKIPNTPEQIAPVLP